MKFWLLTLLLCFSLAWASDEWVRLAACGRAEPDFDQHEFDVPYEPAKNMDRYLIRREDVSALTAPRHKGGIECTYVILVSGESLLVIGNPEYVRRLITGEKEPTETGQ